MGQILMTVRAIDWTEGNVGHVHVLLDGGSCRIDWGDGTDLPYKPEGQDLHAQHTYSGKSEEEEATCVIRIYSDDENIIGIYAGCGNMRVKDIDISGCQTLKFFSASLWVDYFDLKTNPGITRINIDGDSCGIADFSNSLELKELSISYNYEYRLLDLSKCDKLEKLELTSILEGFRIKLPTHCLLKEFIYDESFEYWFPKRTLNKIARIVKQNGGKILRTTRTERLLRKSENNGQM